MFAVDHVLVSDDLLEAPFACDLTACRGGCCVQGEAGAPVEDDERAALEAVYPLVEAMLTPEARRVVAREGVWEETAPGHYNTTCVPAGKHGSGACVFTTFERGVALCAIEKAQQAGRTDIQKPISCALYPIRIQNYGDLDVINYERISLCDSARACGVRAGIELSAFLEGPLTRRYGAVWYARFREAVRERRETLFPPPASPLSPSDPAPRARVDGPEGRRGIPQP
ncbi:MAG TPA: DUF3109 family protein [Rhodothermales bacterium]|nr:DUF3109 family protein [Rhodothermales bacterium]